MALLLLGMIKSERLVSYDTLRKHAKKAVSGGDALFLPSLDFLYLLGLVEYRPKTDSLEYVGPNETL
jgi:hypothetical protein